MHLKLTTVEGNWGKNDPCVLEINTVARTANCPEKDVFIELETYPVEDSDWERVIVYVNDRHTPELLTYRLTGDKEWHCLCLGVHRSSQCVYEAIFQVYSTIR